MMLKISQRRKDSIKKKIFRFVRHFSVTFTLNSFCIHFLNLYYDDGKYFLFDYEVFDTLQIVFRDNHEPKQRFDLLESNNTTVRTAERFRKLDLHDLMTPRL